MMNEIVISTDNSILNIKFINDFIMNSYWGKGRKIEETEKCIDNSLNFGIYMDDVQFGYARVVTDYTIFAYLMDLFIAEPMRGKGYSIKLMNEIVNHPKLNQVKNWKLATTDAHDLYKKYGFELLGNPEFVMERKL